MKPDLAPDQNRRIESAIRFGTVSAVDHAAALCRAQTGGLLTDWLPWFVPRAGETRDWNPPTVGEQCVILSPSGETDTGAVLVGLYQDANPPPDASPDKTVRLWPDGARQEYDHATHDFLLDVPAGGHITLKIGATTMTLEDGKVKGFNATGEYEEKSYHETLESIQETFATPMLEHHHRLVMLSEIMPTLGVEAVETSIAWKPTDAPSSRERAEIRKMEAETDVMLAESGVIEATEVRAKLQADEGSGYSNIETGAGGGDADLDASIAALREAAGMDAGEFNEADHPRNPDGTFGSGGGAGSEPQRENVEEWPQAKRNEVTEANHKNAAMKLSKPEAAAFRAYSDENGELRIDVGLGYRMYYQKRGNHLILLLCAGDKRTQSRDIAVAIDLAKHWKDFSND
ncbi:MAG: phage baseplate assembly protein V [Azoarcus sp.]|jgi:putative addiction module killer protein|nr:phage baseplate assembly protein V [Azoarcus sp.]